MSAGGAPPSSSSDAEQGVTPPAPEAAGEETREPGALAPRQHPGDDNGSGREAGAAAAAAAAAEPSTPPRQQQQQADLGGGALDFGFGNSFGSVIPAWPLSPGAVARRVMESSGFHGHPGSSHEAEGAGDASAAVQRHRLDDIIISDSDARAAAAAAAAATAAVTAAVEDATASAAAAAAAAAAVSSAAAAFANADAAAIDIPSAAVREQVSLPEDIYGAARVSEWHGVPAALAASTYVYDDIWAGDGGLQTRGDIMHITAGWAAGGGFEATQERGGGGEAMVVARDSGATASLAGRGGHSAPALTLERNWSSGSADDPGEAHGKEQREHGRAHDKDVGGGCEVGQQRRRRRRASAREGSRDDGDREEAGEDEQGGDTEERGKREGPNGGGSGNTSPLYWRHGGSHAAKKRRTPSPDSERTSPPAATVATRSFSTGSTGVWNASVEVAGGGASSAQEHATLRHQAVGLPRRSRPGATTVSSPRATCAREEKFYAGRVLEPAAHPPRRIDGAVHTGPGLGFDRGLKADRQPTPLPPPLPPDASERRGGTPAGGADDETETVAAGPSASARSPLGLVRSRSSAEIAAALAAAAPATATTTAAAHAADEIAHGGGGGGGATGGASAASVAAAGGVGSRPSAARDEGEGFFASHALEPRPWWGLDASARWGGREGHRAAGVLLEGPASGTATEGAPRQGGGRCGSGGGGEGGEETVAATAVAREPQHASSDMDWQVQPGAMASYFTTVGGVPPRGSLVPSQPAFARLRVPAGASGRTSPTATAVEATTATAAGEEAARCESPATAAWRRKSLGYSPKGGSGSGSSSAAAIEAAVAAAAAAAAERGEEEGEAPQSRSTSERTSSGSNIDGWNIDVTLGGAGGEEDDAAMDNGSWGW